MAATASPIDALDPSSIRGDYMLTLMDLRWKLIQENLAKGEFIEVTPFLNMTQKEAAKKVHMSSSTLRKRWKDASMNKKWPRSTLHKLDKEISAIMEVGERNRNLDPSQRERLIELIRKKSDTLQPTYICK